MKKNYIIKIGNYYTKRNLPKNFVSVCYHSGDCEKDVKFFFDRFTLVNPQEIKKYLLSIGIDAENFTDYEIKLYIIWIIAGDIAENGFSYLSI